jgi:hypothetical protein
MNNAVRWFEACLSYRRTPECVRKQVSPPTRSSYLRIAALPAAIGEALDERCPPLRVYRFVAWGKGNADIERRLAIVRRLRRELGRWPLDARMYAALVEAQPPSRRAA